MSLELYFTFTAMATALIGQIEAAFEATRTGGHEPLAAYFESRLPGPRYPRPSRDSLSQASSANLRPGMPPGSNLTKKSLDITRAKKTPLPFGL